MSNSLLPPCHTSPTFVFNPPPLAIVTVLFTPTPSTTPTPTPPLPPSICVVPAGARPHSHSMHVRSLRRCVARAPRPSVPEPWWTNGWSLGILIWMCSLVTIGTPSKIKENNFEFQCDVMMSASWKPWHWEVHCLGNLRSPRTIEMATPTTHWFAKKWLRNLTVPRKTPRWQRTVGKTDEDGFGIESQTESVAGLSENDQQRWTQKRTSPRKKSGEQTNLKYNRNITIRRTPLCFHIFNRWSENCMRNGPNHRGSREIWRTSFSCKSSQTSFGPLGCLSRWRLRPPKREAWSQAPLAKTA